MRPAADLVRRARSRSQQPPEPIPVPPGRPPIELPPGPPPELPPRAAATRLAGAWSGGRLEIEVGRHCAQVRESNARSPSYAMCQNAGN